MTDLNNEVGSAEHSVTSSTSHLCDLAKEGWALRRIDEETIIAAIERLNVILVKKRKHRMEKAA